MSASVGARIRAGLVAISLGAFSLRVYHLASQSLWYDEAFSAYLARLPLSTITSLTAGDIHPPLYYYLLHFWVAVAGSGEFALRFLSACAGALTVPVVFRLALELWPDVDSDGLPSRHRAIVIALAATTMAAISPTYIWYAQEARMYSLLTLLGALSSLLMLRWLRGRRQSVDPYLAGWCILSIAAVYTHFYAFFLVAFQAAYGGWRILTTADGRAPLRIASGALALVVAAYLPWLSFTLARFGADVSYWEGTLKVDEIIGGTFLLFAGGHTAATGEDSAIAVVYYALATAGLLLVMNDGRRRTPGGPRLSQLAFLLGYLIIPVLLLLAVSYSRPKFHPRYLLMISPAFYLLAARPFAAVLGPRRGAGVSLLPRRALGLAAAVVVLVSALIPIRHYYANEVLARDDFRSVAGWIQANRGPNEPVILCSGHMYPAVDYYLSLPTIRIPDERTLSTRKLVTYDVADVLNRELAGSDGVWIVLWQSEVVDPNGILLSVVEQQGIAMPVGQSFWGIRLLRYSLPAGAQFAAAPPVETATDVTFTGNLRLAGYRRGLPVASAPTELPITFFWLPGTAMSQDLQVRVRLVDRLGFQWGFYEGRPAAYTQPTFRWQAGTMLPGLVRLTMLAGTPPGEYRLSMSVYPAGSSARLESANATGSPLGQQPVIGFVQVGPEALGVGIQAGQQGFGVASDQQVAPELRLVAYNTPPLQSRLGDVVSVDLLWQATAPTSSEYRLAIRLKAGSGAVAGERLRALSPVPFTSPWPAGSVVRSQTNYAIPADLAPGMWQVEAQLVGSNGSVGSPVTLGAMRIDDRGPLPALGQMAKTMSIGFGESVTLAGFTSSKAGSQVSVSLFWKAGALIDRSYTVFVHAVDANGRVVAQHDSLPVDGAWPTTAWPPGKIVQDTHVMSLPAGLDPFQLRLAVGLYDAATGERLPLTSGQVDSALLGPLLDR